MEPRYYQGEVVYLHPGRPPNPGDFVMVTLKAAEPSCSILAISVNTLARILVHIHLGTLNPKKKHLIARQNLVGMATIVGSGLF